MSEEKINEDELFLALTRPAMIFGMPMEAFGISCSVAGLAMIATDSIFYLLIAVPLLGICRFIVQHDHNAFHILTKWLDTSARCRNKSFWGGASVSPLRVRRRYKIEEID